eukprot:COSAG02_NODE_2794_length_8016_cov_5.159783_7_plen_86_part_00
MMRLAILAYLVATAQATTCDLFDADPATKCVAAHSTVRALYKSYSGPLYQVRCTDIQRAIQLLHLFARPTMGVTLWADWGDGGHS